MTTRHNFTQKSFIMVALLILVGIFAGCNNDKSDNSEPFEFLGEAIGRPENFDKDTIVTPENIDSLYRQYTVEALLNGDYYLIRSKMSYTTSRYLSRLIQMKNGRQVAAQTFYDSDIDANAVIRLKNRIIVGLNSLRYNNYDSTFHMSTHKCRIIVLSDSLTPIQGKRFYSQRGHTYIESLMQNTDSTFFCSVASGDVEYGPKARYQSRVRYNMYVERQTYITNYSDYKIRSEELNLSKRDWGNDLSDEEIAIARNGNEAPENDTLRDSTNIDANVNSQTNLENQESPQIEKHSYVDLGLSVLWASCNVGASSPEEFGEYYAWGEISTKKEYTEDNYKWYGNKKRTEWGYEYKLTKYNSDSYFGRVDNKNKLDNEDDVAIVKWGNGWRMPTYKEWNELRKKCSWKWTCIGDIYGYRVTSSANNNSIFLPAAGEGGHQSKVGHYWASTISYADCANSVDFNESGKQLDYYAGWRQCGYSVRPVKTKDPIE